MKKILLLTIIIIFIPLLIINLNDEEKVLKKIKYGSYSNIKIKVKNSKTSFITEVPIEEYVLGVVAGEMPATFNIEALKAQAVASRTYALYQKDKTKNNYDVMDSTTSQVYITEEKMKSKWGKLYEENYSKIKKTVDETRGEVILYDNKLIDAMFFSTSNGYTENSGDVFVSNLPYLKSVESKWDITESPVFSSTNEFTKKEFLFNLGLNTSDNVDISNIKKTNTGRIIRMTINGVTFKSSEIRTALGLRSTSFTVNVTNDKVIFNVNGFGHGVGMSQYGANGMAKEGYKYQDILKYYYTNCEIKKIN